jgi:hypothetical protein
MFPTFSLGNTARHLRVLHLQKKLKTPGGIGGRGHREYTHIPWRRNAHTHMSVPTQGCLKGEEEILWIFQSNRMVFTYIRKSLMIQKIVMEATLRKSLNEIARYRHSFLTNDRLLSFIKKAHKQVMQII